MKEMLADWMNSFEAAVRNSDYDLGKSLHEPDALFFGTRTKACKSLAEYQVLQWRSIWPNSENFRFTSNLFFETAEDLVVSAMLWENFTTVGGETKHRTGRATYVFRCFEGKLLALHSHYSEDPLPSVT